MDAPIPTSVDWEDPQDCCSELPELLCPHVCAPQVEELAEPQENKITKGIPDKISFPASSRDSQSDSLDSYMDFDSSSEHSITATVAAKSMLYRKSYYDYDTQLEQTAHYDNETIDDTVSTCSDITDMGIGNAPLEIYNVTDDIEYNASMIPKMGKIRLETPATIAAVDTINSIRSRRLLRVLFDSGSMKTMINKSALPRGTVPKPLANEKKLTTLAGKLTTREMVTLRDFRLPEFDKNRSVEEQKALVFDSPCRYDIILGSDFLAKAGININYETGFMEWFDSILPLRDPKGLQSQDFDEMEDALFIQQDDELLGEDWLDSFATEILDARYEHTDIRDVVDNQSHLNERQKDDLLSVLRKHEKLFDGTLGVYPHKKFHIDIKEGAVPVHARAYPVPRIHLETYKRELQHLVKLGVLEPQGLSEWASPSFIAPKKDGRVR